MRQILFLLLLLPPTFSYCQSRSITRFRSDFKEDKNMFFYSSTLKMLNPDNNPELADILDNIEEIRVLNYNKATQQFKGEDLSGLKNSLKEETFNNIMMINEKGNSINLYSREKRGKTIGFVAIVENRESLVLIDLIGTIDIRKFMELKQRLDNRVNTVSQLITR